MPETIPTLEIPGIGKPQEQLKGEAERLSEFEEIRADVLERGLVPYSVINLHPYKIYASGPVHKELKIPGVSLGDTDWKEAKKLKLKSGLEVPWHQHVISHWVASVADVVKGTEGDFTHGIAKRAWLPRDMAMDIADQVNRPVIKGGVFYYPGTHWPLTNPATEQMERAALEKVHLQQMAYYDDVYGETERIYAKQNEDEMRSVTMYNRWVIMYLFRAGRIPKLPSYFPDIQRPGSKPSQHVCEKCGQRVPIEAVQCVNCHRILQPFKAFDIMEVDLSTPGALLLLKRMRPDEVKTLIDNGRFTEEQAEAIGYKFQTVHKKKGTQAD